MNRRSKVIIVAALLIGVSAVYWALNEPAPAEPVAKVTREARDSIPPSEEGLAPAPVAVPTTTEETLVMGQVPDAETVRTQGGENPHTTPRALLDFAHQLAGLMEKALDSEQEAIPVFAQLENCAAGTDGHEVIQARLICFANASRLAKQYPDLLGKRFQLLSAQNHGLAGMLESSGL